MFGPPSANPGDILFQKKQRYNMHKYPRNIQKRKVLDRGGRKEPPYLAAELGADPAGSPIPLGPVSDGSCRGGSGVIRTPSKLLVLLQFPGDWWKKNKKKTSGRLPELRQSSPERLHVSRGHVHASRSDT